MGWKGGGGGGRGGGKGVSYSCMLLNLVET